MLFSRVRRAYTTLQGHPNGFRTFSRDFLYYLYVGSTWIPAAVMFQDWVAEITTVHGPSMYPFLNEDIDRTRRRDVILSFKWNARADLAKGMVITMRFAFSLTPLECRPNRSHWPKAYAMKNWRQFC
jgi:hypothetical protein